MTDSHETYAYYMLLEDNTKPCFTIVSIIYTNTADGELLWRDDKRGHKVIYNNNAWKMTKLLLMQYIKIMAVEQKCS